MTRKLAILAMLGARLASAEPTPTGGKVDAKQLMQSGVKLLEAKDYLGALAIFKDAYARFPSAKILLNIGTTLRLLDRKADAANAYQHYLDSADADPARRPEVTAALAELDKAVGQLDVTVTPDDAQLQFTDEWVPAASAKRWRVSPGPFTVQARRDGYQPDTKSASIAAGEHAAVAIQLAAIPKEVAKPVFVTVPGEVHAAAEPEGPRARFAAIAVVHVSVVPKVGSAWLVGGTADLTPQLAVEAALLLGPGLVSSGMATLPPPKLGGYVGASFSFLSGALRPRIAAGLPVFASSGARFALRGAAGLEYVASRHLSLLVEVGVEHNLNPESDIDNTAFVPALAASGRL